MNHSPVIASVPVYDYGLVPWSATEIGTGRTKVGGRRFRSVTKNKRLVAFQAHVHRVARAIMGDRPAYDGPCYLDLVLRKQTDDTGLHGKFCFVPIGGPTNLRGDVTNYVKAVEDALQGVVYVKDQLVVAGRQMILWASRESVTATVYRLDSPHFTEIGMHPEPWISVPRPATEPGTVAG